MDRDAIARGRRGREVHDALEFERDREASLLEMIEEVVVEEERPRIDRALQALLDPADLCLVEDLFVGADERSSDTWLEDGFVPLDEDPASTETTADEVARLQEEIEHSRARQAALERVATLLRSTLPEPVQPDDQRSTI